MIWPYSFVGHEKKGQLSSEISRLETSSFLSVPLALSSPRHGHSPGVGSFGSLGNFGSTLGSLTLGNWTLGRLRSRGALCPEEEISFYVSIRPVASQNWDGK